VYELEDKLKQTKLDKKRASNINKKDIGYSLKGDVDLMHYNIQSVEDLKKIHDKVIN